MQWKTNSLAHFLTGADQEAPYYRTHIKDADSKRVSLYSRTEKELVAKPAMAKVTTDIYARIKYNNPEELSAVVNEALDK